MDDSGVQATIQEHILFALIYDIVICWTCAKFLLGNVLPAYLPAAAWLTTDKATNSLTN